MTPPAPYDTLLAVIAAFFIPLAAAGIALMNAGLGRSRSAAHSMVASLCVMAVAVIVYFSVASSFAGYVGGPVHSLHTTGRTWDWIGAGPLFFRGLPADASRNAIAAWVQLFTVAIAALIPLGSGGDRWRLGASCASTALLAGFVYPLFAHWTRGGGWLSGGSSGLSPALMDAGGSGAIHGVGGLTALAVAWILGHRRGKYASDGMPAAFPAHNAVLVLFGCLIALPGWIGLNVAGALLFGGVGALLVPRVVLSTVLAAAGGGLAAAAVTRTRFGKPDASLVSNGWVGGLVAGSAGCASVAPAGALVTGAVAGALVARSIEVLEVHLGIDDPGGSISVHAIAGIWGLLAAGILAGRAQLLAQVIGIATLLGLVLPMTYGLNWLLDRVYRQRVDVEGERVGMDLYELGAGAYPDFLSHSDEFIQH